MQILSKGSTCMSRRTPRKTAKDTEKITNQAIKSYYGKASCNVTNELSVKLELSNVSKEVIKKTLLKLDIS